MASDCHSFEEQLSGFRFTASSPAGSDEAKTGIGAPNCFRVDLGVVPLTRPAEISNGVSLSDKLGREVRPFVSEEGAFDALLGRLGVVDVVSPNKGSIGCSGTENDVLARPDKLAALPAVSVSAARIVPF